jgi:hypothetical protein
MAELGSETARATQVVPRSRMYLDSGQATDGAQDIEIKQRIGENVDSENACNESRLYIMEISVQRKRSLS